MIKRLNLLGTYAIPDNSKSVHITTLDDKTLEEMNIENVQSDGWFLVYGDDDSIHGILAKFVSKEAVDYMASLFEYIDMKYGYQKQISAHRLKKIEYIQNYKNDESTATKPD